MKKYQIIYADPPWKFTGLGSKGIRSGKMREDSQCIVFMDYRCTLALCNRNNEKLGF